MENDGLGVGHHHSEMRSEIDPIRQLRWLLNS